MNRLFGDRSAYWMMGGLALAIASAATFSCGGPDGSATATAKPATDDPISVESSSGGITCGPAGSSGSPTCPPAPNTCATFAGCANHCGSPIFPWDATGTILTTATCACQVACRDVTGSWHPGRYSKPEVLYGQTFYGWVEDDTLTAYCANAATCGAPQ